MVGMDQDKMIYRETFPGWSRFIVEKLPGPNIFSSKKRAPPILPAIGIRPPEEFREEQCISFCFQYDFAGANHQAGFSPSGVLLAGITQ